MHGFFWLIFPAELGQNQSQNEANHPCLDLFTPSPASGSAAGIQRMPDSATYLSRSVAGLRGQCGARATQQLCLMSSKRLQTWALIPSAARRPVSDAGCQRPSRSISDGTRWEQTVGFSRKQCSSQETGVSLQTLDHGESIGSRFCFFYETATFKGRHKASHSIWM